MSHGQPPISAHRPAASESVRKMSAKRKWLWGSALAVVVLLAAGTVWWVQHFKTYTPAAALRDLRAAASVRREEHPVNQFLEARYGALNLSENRQKAFVDFFEVGHIEGLFLITGHLAGSRKQTNILDMAQWLANYRTNMPPEDREALRKYVTSEEGRLKVKMASEYYLQKDVYFRSASAPVIKELMTTLTWLQQP